jgi:hypothetical protein
MHLQPRLIALWQNPRSAWGIYDDFETFCVVAVDHRRKPTRTVDGGRAGGTSASLALFSSHPRRGDFRTALRDDIHDCQRRLVFELHQWTRRVLRWERHGPFQYAATWLWRAKGTNGEHEPSGDELQPALGTV